MRYSSRRLRQRLTWLRWSSCACGSAPTNWWARLAGDANTWAVRARRQGSLGYARALAFALPDGIGIATGWSGQSSPPPV
jgi:hypothetical protein